MNGQEVESPTHRGTGCHSCSAPDQVGLSPSPGTSLSVDASSGQRSFILDYPGDGNRASCMGSGLAWWSVGVAGLGVQRAWCLCSQPGSKQMTGTSLAAQWIRVCLPMQGDTGSIPAQRTMVSSKKKKRVHWDTLRGIKADHGEKHSLRETAPLHKPGPFSTGKNLKLSGTGLNTQRSEDKIPSQHLSIPISAWESKSPLNSDENSEEKNVMDIQR